jgi:hypothetical protein
VSKEWKTNKTITDTVQGGDGTKPYQGAWFNGVVVVVVIIIIALK